MTKQHDPKDEKPKAHAQKPDLPRLNISGTVPTIGAIVHFALPGFGDPAPAIVTGVNHEDDSKVDLLVALPHGHPNGHTMSRAGILLDDSETPAEHTWHWPARA